jgi:2-keto-4-pentenoate hydratase/2-oxohepta-3-ene-1,7-dioic acid hydratase in catechol pathway
MELYDHSKCTSSGVIIPGRALSECMTLTPGDLICTGAPPGVGTGMKPPKFLNVGDVMTLRIAGLGEQRQRVVSFDEPNQ